MQMIRVAYHLRLSRMATIDCNRVLKSADVAVFLHPKEMETNDVCGGRRDVMRLGNGRFSFRLSRRASRFSRWSCLIHQDKTHMQTTQYAYLKGHLSIFLYSYHISHHSENARCAPSHIDHDKSNLTGLTILIQ